MNLIERLRRRAYHRTEWVEPHGKIDVPVPADMAEWDGVQSTPVNPDGPEAADRIEALEAALAWYADQMCEGLCMDKDPKFCANIGADNCSGCPAVVALKNPIDTPRG